MIEKLFLQQTVFCVIFVFFWLAYARFGVAQRLFGQLSDGAARLGKWRGGLRGGIEEIPKFAVLRVLFGVFLLWRVALIMHYAYPADWESAAFVFTVSSSAICALALVLGAFTQWALIVLVLFQWQIGERITASATLGNDIAAMLSLLLFLTNAGSRLSIDYILMRRRPPLRRRLLYFSVNDDDIIAAKVISLFCYWLVCMYSFCIHLAEAAWIQGFAGPQLLTNNFMSKFYSEFIFLFETFPPSIYFFIGAMWVMLPWYVLLLPLVLLGGIFRIFIICWGLMFFSLSLFVLSLGWLAEFEFVFWAALFLYRSGKIDLIYDDRCNLCDRTVNFVKRVDLLNTVRLRGISQNTEWVTGHGLSKDQVLKDLYGHDEKTGTLVGGYDLYLILSRTVLVLLPLWPIFKLGKIIRIGPMIYRFIADRRIKYFGVCMLPTPKPSWEGPTDTVKMPRAVPLFYGNILALALFYLIAIPAPYVGWDGFKTYFARVAHTYGLTPIDVFNRGDLKMTENWFVLEREDGSLVPVLNEDGSRAEYHRSDRVYFGGTLRFRRRAVQGEGCLFDLPRTQRLINNLASLHHKLTGYEGSLLYRQYHQPIADPEKILAMQYVTSDTKVVCEEEF